METIEDINITLDLALETGPEHGTRALSLAKALLLAEVEIGRLRAFVGSDGVERLVHRAVLAERNACEKIARDAAEKIGDGSPERDAGVAAAMFIATAIHSRP